MACRLVKRQAGDEKLEQRSNEMQSVEDVDVDLFFLLGSSFSPTVPFCQSPMNLAWGKLGFAALAKLHCMPRKMYW